jgi:hypothetical protein
MINRCVVAVHEVSTSSTFDRKRYIRTCNKFARLKRWYCITFCGARHIQHRESPYCTYTADADNDNNSLESSTASLTSSSASAERRATKQKIVSQHDAARCIASAKTGSGGHKLLSFLQCICISSKTMTCSGTLVIHTHTPIHL